VVAAPRKSPENAFARRPRLGRLGGILSMSLHAWFHVDNEAEIASPALLIHPDRSACPTAASSCPSLRSASWACAR